MVLPALVWEKPTTLGTLMVDWLLDTVSLTTVVDLTEVPAAGSWRQYRVPAACCW